MPDRIAPADKKKVEKGLKLLNRFELLKGEEVFRKLRDENPQEEYFHEALVSIQKQILEQILMAKSQMADLVYQEKQMESEAVMNHLSAENVYVNNGLLRTDSAKEKTIEMLGENISNRDRRRLLKSVEETETKESNTSSRKLKKKKGRQEKPDEEIVFENLNVTEQKIEMERLRAKQYGDLLAMDPEVYRREMINTCRNATRIIELADSASRLLRMNLLDTIRYGFDFDPEEKENWAAGWGYFQRGDYVRAIKLIEPLAEANPDNFDVLLLQSDCYFNMGMDSNTIKSCKYLIKRWPSRPEGRERMSRYYTAKGLFTDAAREIIEAILIYPEDTYWEELRLILSKSGRKFNSQWVRRDVYPVTSKQNFEEIIANERSPWYHYQNIKSLLYSYTSPETGVIKPGNEITKETYMEVYAWKSMLARMKDKTKFPFAQSMQRMGLLDCYVLITLFHHDLYEPFKHLVENNPQKVRDYFYVLINWEEKKFDAYRKQGYNNSQKGNTSDKK